MSEKEVSILMSQVNPKKYKKQYIHETDGMNLGI